MKFFKKKIPVQNDEWQYWNFYDEDDYYGLCFVDITYLEEETQKGFRKEYYLKLIIPEAKILAAKFPSPETNLELQKIEDDLITLLEKERVNCKQVHRNIYFGAKRMQFEVKDVIEFEEVVAKWKKLIKDYILEVTEDEPWITYNEIRPNEYIWQQIGNRWVFDKLVESGSNPAKVHLIENGILGNPIDLKQLEIELIKEGGRTLHFENDSLEIGFECHLDLDEINNLTDYLMYKAKEYNCEYNGWSAEIVK